MRTLNDATVVLFVLGMMATMFMSAVYYLYYPVFDSIIILLIFNTVAMGVFLLPLLASVFFGNKGLEEVTTGSRFSLRSIVSSSAVGLAIASEVFMGWTFALLAGSVQVAGTLSAAGSSVVSSSSSYWFVFTMATEMAITLLVLRKSFLKGAGGVVACQAAIMFLSPTAFGGGSWSDFALVAGSAVMALLFAYIFRLLYRSRRLEAPFLRYILRIVAAYALMMAGLALWFVDGDASLFVLAIVAEMTIYFNVVLGSKLAPARAGL